MKKISALALAAALTGSLLTPALAAEGLLISPNPNAYPNAITVNGTALDTAALPNAQGIPLRLLAESDHGSAAWYAEENTGSFYMNGNAITVNFADCSVQLNGETLENVAAEVKSGVTFLPAEVLLQLEGYTVNTEAEGRVEITTPNNAPLVKLTYEILDASGAAAGMKAKPEDLGTYGIDPECFTEVVGFFPMMISPDTVLVGKLAEGKEEAAKTALEAYRQQQADTFSWYLSQNLPKVEDARTVVKDGYLLFVIAEKPDAAIAAFEAGLEALAQ